MHSHNQTLLSKLGFADPDKNDPRHDLACQYLGQTKQILRLFQLAMQPVKQEFRFRVHNPNGLGDGWQVLCRNSEKTSHEQTQR